MPGLTFIIYAVATVFAIIELGLIAYDVDVTRASFYNWLGYHTNSPARLNFMLFNCVWTILVLAYLYLSTAISSARRFFNPLVALILEALTAIFWFAGSVALAAAWGAPLCHDNTFCGTIEAACAFGFFLWAIFTGLAILDGLANSGRRGGKTTQGSAA